MKKSVLTYVMGLWICFGWVCVVWGADRGEIQSGETRTGLEILGPSYMDTWTFQGNAGDRVLFNAEAITGSIYLYIDLYPPDSGPCEDHASLSMDHQLTQSGLYTVMVHDAGNDAEGTYNVSFSKIPATLRPGLYNPSPSNGANIDSLSGSLNWDAVTGASGYDVYFGENVTAPLQQIGSNVASPPIAFPTMEWNKVYYWHVVAHTASGDTQGPYWWFIPKTTNSYLLWTK